jgi:hypothetical protein
MTVESFVTLYALLLPSKQSIQYGPMRCKGNTHEQALAMVGLTVEDFEQYKKELLKVGFLAE